MPNEGRGEEVGAGYWIKSPSEMGMCVGINKCRCASRGCQCLGMQKVGE